MINVRNGLVMLAVMAFSATASAEDLYNSVGPDGVVEYSDTPQPDSEQIEVNPNVVEVAPVAPSGDAQEPAPVASAPAPAGNADPAVVYGEDGGNYYYPERRPAAVSEAREPGVVAVEPHTEAGVGDAGVDRNSGVNRSHTGGKR